MQVKIEPFVAEHGVEILGQAAEPILDWLIKAECCGPAFTGRLQDGRILGSAGIVLETPQMGHGWLLPTPLVKQYPLAFHRVVSRYLADIIQTHPELRCIQGYTDPAFPERERWVERLGFERVGQTRSLWPEKKDVLLYAMLVGNGHGT